tara:strand:+ start:573 stop:1688 length:1116 start_codon:yes stop_codon:yes gene_type:complete
MDYFLYKRYCDIPSGEWNELLSDQNFFISPACVQILEAEHEDEIEPLYIVIKEKAKVIGIVYAQLFLINGNKLKEYINNGNKGFNILNEIKVFLANKIHVKVGFLGNVFLSNEESYKFHSTKNQSFLPSILELIVQETEAKFVLIPENYEDSTPLLGRNCREIYVEPDMQLKIPAEWTSFEDYIEAISSKYKKRYRSVLKKSSALEKRALSPSDLKRESTAMKRLFNNVFSKSKFNAAKFNTDVFYDLKLVKENVSIFGYYYDDKLLGFASEIAINGILYAHFVGIDYQYNNTFEIYNRMLYEQIRYAIDHKLSLIKFGRTASEFKSTIGASPYKGYGYIYHPCKTIIKAASPILRLLKPKDWTQRHPFKS